MTNRKDEVSDLHLEIYLIDFMLMTKFQNFLGAAGCWDKFRVERSVG